MLEKLLKPLTTARAGGVVFRDAFIAVGALITLLGIVGVLTPDQVIELKRVVEDISGQWPAIAMALGALMTAGMSFYRAIYKSSSDRAAEVAKQVDEKLPPNVGMTLTTPGDLPNLTLPKK
jgi:hypothetical protein